VVAALGAAAPRDPKVRRASVKHDRQRLLWYADRDLARVLVVVIVRQNQITVASVVVALVIITA
jgi:hypothetical protein